MQRWNIFSTISLILLGWLGLSAGVLYTTDAAPGAIVLFPSETFMQNLPPQAAITAGGPLSVTFASTQPGLTAALYQSGAWLVLPAGLTGCLKPPSAFKPQ